MRTMSPFRLFDWKVAGPSAFENLVDVSGHAPRHVEEACAVGHQAACGRELTYLRDRRQLVRFRTVLPLLKNTERCEVDADAATDI